LRKNPPKALETGDTLYFELLRQWLQDCDQNHTCNRNYERHIGRNPWPTRVIYVGHSASSKLKLLETTLELNTIRNETYVALSHCWGKPTDHEEMIFCTTTENYKDRLKGFSIENLPRTFQDAVQITQAIGKKYLWIDALCIIQKDKDDWEAEAMNMEKVFNSAYCTIAADSAVDWKQGFLRRKFPQFTTVEKSGVWMYTCDTKEDFESHVNSSRLNKRAWVLQERVLSRRILHFTESHTYFACGESVRCENFMKLRR
jgi:hypothetical protein